MRVGLGYDVHPLMSGRKLILGGVEVSHHKGLEAHTDGDVLVHAIIDALLGAAALGDIGTHFPPDDDRFKGARSLDLLATTSDLVSEAGFMLVNIDATVMAQAPRLAPHIAELRETLAGALRVDASCVSVKATTTDRLGFVGRGEGIAAIAVALIDST